MKKLACILAFSLAACSAFAATPTAPEAKEPEVTPALELKHKSSFVMEDNSRNPFWPIGWKPATKQTAATTNEQVGPEIQASSFTVTSITVDSTGKYAIVNGKVMMEGQVFGLQLGNQTYQITLKAIQDGQVILMRRDQEIPVPLRRR